MRLAPADQAVSGVFRSNYDGQNAAWYLPGLLWCKPRRAAMLPDYYQPLEDLVRITVIKVLKLLKIPYCQNRKILKQAESSLNPKHTRHAIVNLPLANSGWIGFLRFESCCYKRGNGATEHSGIIKFLKKLKDPETDIIG